MHICRGEITTKDKIVFHTRQSSAISGAVEVVELLVLELLELLELFIVSVLTIFVLEMGQLLNIQSLFNLIVVFLSTKIGNPRDII